MDTKTMSKLLTGGTCFRCMTFNVTEGHVCDPARIPAEGQVVTLAREAEDGGTIKYSPDGTAWSSGVDDSGVETATKITRS